MMNEYQDRLMAEAKELERAAKEEHRIALMTLEEKHAYFYAKSLVSEGIYWSLEEDRWVRPPSRCVRVKIRGRTSFMVSIVVFITSARVQGTGVVPYVLVRRVEPRRIDNGNGNG